MCPPTCCAWPLPRPFLRPRFSRFVFCYDMQVREPRRNPGRRTHAAARFRMVDRTHGTPPRPRGLGGHRKGRGRICERSQGRQAVALRPHVRAHVDLLLDPSPLAHRRRVGHDRDVLGAVRRPTRALFRGPPPDTRWPCGRFPVRSGIGRARRRRRPVHGRRRDAARVACGVARRTRGRRGVGFGRTRRRLGVHAVGAVLCKARHPLRGSARLFEHGARVGGQDGRRPAARRYPRLSRSPSPPLGAFACMRRSLATVPEAAEEPIRYYNARTIGSLVRLAAGIAVYQPHGRASSSRSCSKATPFPRLRRSCTMAARFCSALAMVAWVAAAQPRASTSAVPGGSSWSSWPRRSSSSRHSRPGVPHLPAVARAHGPNVPHRVPVPGFGRRCPPQPLPPHGGVHARLDRLHPSLHGGQGGGRRAGRPGRPECGGGACRPSCGCSWW